jgi:hypothetical protein
MAVSPTKAMTSGEDPCAAFVSIRFDLWRILRA